VRRAVDVETDGTLTRGMTVVDERAGRGATGNVEVAMQIDAPRALSLIFETLGSG
jgi:inosine-uridine nucleoside N-ribohydrolase